MININDWTEGNICGGGEWEVVQREVVQRILRIIRLFLLCTQFIAVSFFSLQLMWLQLIIESADFHPDTHARETASAHIHTPCVRAFALFTGQNGAEPERGHLRSIFLLSGYTLVSVVRLGFPCGPRVTSQAGNSVWLSDTTPSCWRGAAMSGRASTVRALWLVRPVRRFPGVGPLIGWRGKPQTCD